MAEKQRSARSSSSRTMSSKDGLSYGGSERIETRLGLKEMEELMAAFISNITCDEEHLRLNKEEFGDRLSRLVKKGTREEYMELFDRIDITNEGLVDWDMFVQFMLLEFYEKDEKVKTTQVPQWKELKNVASPHKDKIQRVELLKASNRYLTISKDGIIAFWNHHVKLQRHLRISTDTVKSRDLWVTDFALLQNINKVAVSFTSKEIAFYDLSSKLEFNCQYKLQGLKNIPLCMDYWTNPENANESTLVFGDVGGNVTALCFTSAQIALFDRPSQGSDGKQPNDNNTLCVPLRDLLHENSKHSNCRVVRHSAHSGWVRQVRYVENLECFVSVATGKQNCIVIGFVEKASSTMRTTAFKYNQGLHCFDYHKQMNLIATGGIDNTVCLWNPYVISKPVGILTGHMAPVVQIIVNRSRSQLISFSQDKVLRIWDIQQQVCLQRVAGIFPKGPEVSTQLFFDDCRHRLFITFNNQLTLLEMKVERNNRVMSHEKPVTSVLYNTLYNQVITACQAGVVTVWMIDNGQKVKQFTDCHGAAEITTLQLDQSQTRLYTGSTDGTIKVWDFNGHCHHVLNTSGGQPADVGQIVMLKRSIITIGWNKQITVFRQGALSQYHVEPADWVGGGQHMDDILCADYMAHTMLATGSYDGEIVIWNPNSECASKKLQQRCKARLSRANTKMSMSAASDRPQTSESQASELELSFVVSRLIFLKHRLEAGECTGADLLSTGGGGWIRFWNTTKAVLMSEFVAHPHAGNVIATTDAENQFLITADSDGVMKTWNISNYLLNDEGNTTLNFAPPCLNSWQAHNDYINSIATCFRYERLFVISASSDCSVALWDMNGNKIGEFGQDTHWKLDAIVAAEEEEVKDEKEAQEEASLFKDFDINEIELESRCSTAPERIATSDGLPPKPVVHADFDGKTWDNTVLGKSYQEGRLNKRERKQPGTVPGYKQYIEESAVGPYGILGTTELDAMEMMKKPDFMTSPHKYFGEKTDKSNKKAENGAPEEPSLSEVRHVLKAAFDEKTFFPKELLDFEAQIRQENNQKLNIGLHSGLHRESSRKGIMKVAGIMKSGLTTPSNLVGKSTTPRISSSSLSNGFKA